MEIGPDLLFKEKNQSPYQRWMGARSEFLTSSTVLVSDGNSKYMMRAYKEK